MPRAGEPLSDFDKTCVRALRGVGFGLNRNAGRIAQTLDTAMERELEISARQRHALYAICWRYRRQLAVKLQAKVAIALAELSSVAAFEQYESETPRIRAFRADAAMAMPQNPFNDLFRRVSQ
jgi:hypothetical protein